MLTVTDSYLLGISEGRNFLKANPGLTLAEKQECLETCKRLIGQGFSQPMKDVFKGERDFWINQIKKG